MSITVSSNQAPTVIPPSEEQVNNNGITDSATAASQADTDEFPGKSSVPTENMGAEYQRSLLLARLGDKAAAPGFASQLDQTKNASKQKDRLITVELPAPAEQMTVSDYESAMITEMFKRSGLSDLSEKELKEFQQKFADSTGSRFGLTSSLNELKEKTVNGKFNVYVSDYDFSVIAIGKQEIVSAREAVRKTGEEAYRQAVQDTDNIMKGFIAAQVNAPINLINGMTEPVRGIANKAGIEIPELPRWRAAEQSEYWRKDGRIAAAEFGSTAALGLTLGAKFSDKLLETTTGKAITATESAYNIAVGAAGVDPTQKDASGNDRQMGNFERGLRIAGGLFGARSVSKNLGGAPAATSSTPTDAQFIEAITPEGVKVNIPVDPTKGLPDAESLNILSKSEKLSLLKDGSKAGREKLKEVAQEGLDDIAQASVKKLQKVISKERIAQIKEQLVTLNITRTEMMARLDTLNKLELTEEAASDIGKAYNSYNEHLTQDDLIGALRDIHGLQVKRSGDGYPFKHLGEVQDGMKSLTNARKTIIKEMRKYSRDSEEFRQLSIAADGLNETISRIDKFLEVK